MKEFEIIARYLTLDSQNRNDVLQGIGDDCALLKVPRGQRLAVSMDTLIGGVHFLEDCEPADIAHKAVAVNLSDLAAAGAEPAWITLSLSLPNYNEEWLNGFSQGLKRIVDFFGVQLVGGDTCQGPLSITIQAHGFVPDNVFLTRSGAKAGELICVTGELGDAAAGLLVAQKQLHPSEDNAVRLLKKYQAPYPNIAAGIALRGRATAAIDISDGLLADVNHISQQSGVGALLRWERVPLSEALVASTDLQTQMQLALTGGDDYQLCFTIKEAEFESTKMALETVGSRCIAIGRLTGKPGVKVLHHKEEVILDDLGYQHF